MKKNNKLQPIVLAAGGTGGHIFPAQAVAELFINRHKLFLVTDQRGTKFLKGALLKAEKEVLPVKGFTSSINDKTCALTGLIFSFLKLFFKFFLKRPSIVIGFGGYPSVPAIMAAFFHQIPTIIHEQNAVMGKANKFLANFVNVVALSFKNTLNVESVANDKVVYTGNPVRQQIFALSGRPYKKLDKNIFKILVISGSQGAAIFSHAIPQAVKLLDPKIQENLYIYQQARQDLLQKTIDEYHSTKSKVEIKSFFEDIENLLYKCDLVIARAGAATVTEIIVSRKPSILIPFAAAQNNHQFFNAKFLSDQQASILIEEKELTPELLAKTISELITNTEEFSKLQAAMKKVKCQNSVQALADLILKLKA
ncbi:MAG: undecaprenyldiphospho-muramoylpentapeptide beta-N-acetylglucosaminyltransferase [Candidatus Midichloria sp.]|uniref:Undecaprenyldiphospho-muramoylpentapeptide beta-N-acetylglucosaminyltransferase n=1 Tax=Hyalomma marginatum TaxID=34627 RepID=A0A8S4C2X0_9ACAR|nr:undecaprenyldiphospho-muramoylpentapeptide beta-N-acetylglucosaminyltransferase [Hyalomma marginatum]CAG7600834.1 undecaprenyldiphospho-muramoylpentapeptide beta-N-acetylglucosaminyltransferase [Hyalomma marginatum]